MTELEYVLDGFEEHFAVYKDRRILLHGSREYASAIIDHFSLFFNFIGVISYELEETETFCGLPVYSDTDIEHLDADLVIITERVRYGEIVFRNIAEVCRRSNTAIFNMYGLDEQTVYREIYSCSRQDLEGWVKICSGYDIIAFEVMDTLLYPVFEDLVPDIRKEFASLITNLRSQGKQIWFSLRKSYSEELQLEYLQAASLISSFNTVADDEKTIDKDFHIIRRRGEDLSFRKFRSAFPDARILYIGSGLVNECFLPRCYGIDTYRYIGSITDHVVWIRRHNSYPDNHCSRDMILQKIRNHDVISFDIFDTLLIRQTLFPEDVFDLTERKALQVGINAHGFAGVRKVCEADAGCSTIYKIYERLQTMLNVDSESLQKLLELEIATEIEVLGRRDEVAELLDLALGFGKTVILASDMYLPAEILKKILTEKGITGYTKIFVSCDQGRSKEEGLFSLIKEAMGEEASILHIGDNAAADGTACIEQGLDHVIIPSPIELAAARGWEEVIGNAGRLSEHLLAGIAISHLFKDPFQSYDLSDLSVRERLERYAYGALGPLVIGFVTWIIDRVRCEGCDNVLFLARDGYILLQVYRLLKTGSEMPEGIYYYANRKASFLCAADDLSRMWQILDQGLSLGLTEKQILENYYGYSEGEVRTAGDSLSMSLITSIPWIREKAAVSRQGFRTYSENCGMKKDSTYFVVDFVSAGTTQKHLSPVLPYKFRGLYFGTYTDEAQNSPDIEFYCRDRDNGLIRDRHYIEAEAFLTSPEASQSGITQEGEPVFSKDRRTEQELAEFELVFSYIADMARSFARFSITDEIVNAGLIVRMYDADGMHMVQRTSFDDWNNRAFKLQTITECDGERKHETE